MPGLAHRGNHSVLGLAPTRHRLCVGRGRRVGAAALVSVSADRRPVDDRRLADRRGAGSRARTRDRFSQRRIRRRLVDGLRLFSRRPLVGRLGALVEADKFAWALPLAVVALPAALAVFPAAGFALARLLWSPGPARIFALAFGLGVAEWARGLLFTGFPWNDLGMALGVNLALAQTASLVGLHGLTFLTIAIFAAPATLWRVSESRLNLAPTIVAALALVLMAAFGEFRLMAPASATLPGVKLRLIQPNVGQDDASFRPETSRRSCAAISTCRSARPRRIDPGFETSPT